MFLNTQYLLGVLFIYLFVNPQKTENWAVGVYYP